MKDEKATVTSQIKDQKITISKLEEEKKTEQQKNESQAQEIINLTKSITEMRSEKNSLQESQILDT